MRIAWAMQIRRAEQAEEKSGKDATPGHTVAAVYDRRTRRLVRIVGGRRPPLQNHL
jgi:hypothetical protein